MLSFRQKPEYYHWLNIIFVICLALLAYGTTLGHSFVWDDFYLIVDNDFVKSWDNIHLLFKNDYLTPLNKLDYTGEMFIGSGELSYRPVSTLSHFVEYHFWKLNPFGYHLTNMILHTINAILVYAFVCLLRQPKRISLLTSVLFAIHPVNSEVVNVISFREDLLVVFFGLLALIAYLFLCENRKYNFWIYCSSMVFYFLALFSKEMAITIPFLMLLSRYYVKQEKLSKESFWPHIKKYGGGYIILTLFYLWVWAFPMARNTDLMINYFDGNVLVRIMTMTKVIGVYLVWLCFPVDIHATISDYSFVVRSISDPYFLTAAFSIICLTLFVYQWRQLMAFLCFATLWFWITLLPVLNIKLMPNIYASRFLYLPSIGFFLAVAVVFWKIYSFEWGVFAGSCRRLLVLLLIMFLIVFAAITRLANMDWKDQFTFQFDVLEHYPNAPEAHSGLGDTFKRKYLYDLALLAYQNALLLEPQCSLCHNNMGEIYMRLDKPQKALEEFQQAVEKDDQNLVAQTNVCVSLGSLEQYQQSADCFQSLLKWQPHYVQAYFNLGVTYQRMGMPEKAKEIWEKGFAVDSSFVPLREVYDKH